MRPQPAGIAHHAIATIAHRPVGAGDMSRENPLRVVVVDDDPDIRLMLRLAFEHDGRLTVVAEAADGAAAADVARRAQPDLVLMDFSMPVVDGLVALPLVRAATGPETTVVIMSATPTPPPSLQQADVAFVEKHGDLAPFVDRLLELAAARDQTEDAETAVSWVLPADLRSGALARVRLRDLLGRWDLGGILDEVQLLSTELINNAVVHARSEVVLDVQRRSDVLHVAVTDSGAGAPHKPDRGLDATSGRGLMLVETLSRTWGVAVNGQRKTLWFEVGLPDPVGCDR